ncbi:signal peptidase II [Anoxybacterium hadale]|uniref:Signal peptidase II n=1 Tax=Anoxybacterium hadale TaxID=3408580 RepID=A0ACD1A874_9FIRM|nr:signal peptidase II [Clostridiales bacterium]
MYFIIIAFILIADQGIKYLIRAAMELNQSIPLIDGIFHITYIHNYGAAFSILQNKTVFLIAVQVIVISGILVYLVKKRKTEHPMLLLSLAMIVAGGLGNLIDRAANGYVVDFLDLRFWPIFNIADISVCVGCGLMVLYVLIIEPKRSRSKI